MWNISLASFKIHILFYFNFFFDVQIFFKGLTNCVKCQFNKVSLFTHLHRESCGLWESCEISWFKLETHFRKLLTFRAVIYVSPWWFTGSLGFLTSLFEEIRTRFSDRLTLCLPRSLCSLDISVTWELSVSTGCNGLISPVKGSF